MKSDFKRSGIEVGIDNYIEREIIDGMRKWRLVGLQVFYKIANGKAMSHANKSERLNTNKSINHDNFER